MKKLTAAALGFVACILAANYDYARRIGCDSVDGTYLRFGPDKNLPRLLSWIEAAA